VQRLAERYAEAEDDRKCEDESDPAQLAPAASASHRRDRHGE
jgi:hypothetical protein